MEKLSPIWGYRRFQVDMFIKNNELPTIEREQCAGWTFVGFPHDRNQWMKAVEFIWNEQVCRQEFDLGQFGNAYNYKDCGDPRARTFRPTPTPRP